MSSIPEQDHQALFVAAQQALIEFRDHSVARVRELRRVAEQAERCATDSELRINCLREEIGHREKEAEAYVRKAQEERSSIDQKLWKAQHECEALRSEVERLTTENGEFKKVSRVVAIENENARLLEEIARIRRIAEKYKGQVKSLKEQQQQQMTSSAS